MPPRVPLARQIAMLSQTAPADLDPEDIYLTAPQSDDDSHDVSRAATEHYIDVGSSRLRQANPALSDPKYHGKRVSREDLASDESDTDTARAEDSHDGSRSPTASRGASPIPSLRAPGAVLEQCLAQPAGTVTSSLATALRATREQDRKKGRAVARQVTLWDSLLDARIRLQKSITAVDTLSEAQLRSAAVDPCSVVQLHRMLDEATALSEEIALLRKDIVDADATPSTSPPLKRIKLVDKGERNHGVALRTASAEASSLEASYHPRLLHTITKWSAKLHAVAPNALLAISQSPFKDPSGGTAGTHHMLGAICATLQACDSTHRRTSSGGSKLGDGVQFDDTAFYQQLIRDIIESRQGAGQGQVAEPGWIRRQQALKMKRKNTVDSRASKGRKIRYEVNEKLQSFMVPIPASQDSWHDGQIDKLFASLLSTLSYTMNK